MTHQQYYVGIKALLKRLDGKFLVLHKSGASMFNTRVTGWDLPGGRMELGMEPIPTLHKELKEEIGFDLGDYTVGRCISAAIAQIVTHSHRPGVVFFMYECMLTNKQKPITLSHEHTDYKWVTQDELKELLQLDTYKILLMNYQ